MESTIIPPGAFGPSFTVGEELFTEFGWGLLVEVSWIISLEMYLYGVQIEDEFIWLEAKEIIF
jgi:hypothetical protein